MTVKQIQERNEKAQQLQVIQVNESWFYVESSEGKVCYKVMVTEEQKYCTCPDFAANINKDPSFRCKHILAVMNCISTGEVDIIGQFDKRKPRLDERFITEIQGKEFVTYPGLLDLAHQKGLMKLDVEPIQFPTKENGMEAICRAIAKSRAGEVFSDIGDANPGNCHTKVSKHILRIASTRAKARVLRDLTNIGMTCLEELGDFDEVVGNEAAPARETKSSNKRTASSRSGGAKPARAAESARSANPGPDREGTAPADHQGSKSIRRDEARPNSGQSSTRQGQPTEGTQNQHPPCTSASNPPAKSETSTRPENNGQQGSNGSNRSNSSHGSNSPTGSNGQHGSTGQNCSNASNGGNGGNGANGSNGGGNVPRMSEAQKRAVYNLSRRRGISVEELEDMALKAYNTSLESLSSQDASSFIRQLQSAA